MKYEHDACYSCGHDANIYEDEFAIVPYVKHEIVAIAPRHDSPIIFLNSPNYTISEKFVLSKDYIEGLPFTVAHDDFDRYNMHVLAAPTCNYYERVTTSPPLCFQYNKIARNCLCYVSAFILCT